MESKIHYPRSYEKIGPKIYIQAIKITLIYQKLKKKKVIVTIYLTGKNIQNFTI